MSTLPFYLWRCITVQWLRSFTFRRGIAGHQCSTFII